MALTEQGIERLMGALRLNTPIVALYDTDPSGVFEPMVKVGGRDCCFTYYQRWVNGETVVVERSVNEDFMDPKHGCPGLQKHLGFDKEYPPWMANFLTDGENGAPMGEGLKATPALAQDFIDNIEYPEPSGNYMLIGPLKLDQFDKVETVSFFADPDRLSALMTLAAYWSSDPDEVAAPFSSGCGMMWEVLGNQQKDRAVIGCTDIAMRRYLPPEIMCLTVTPQRFEHMVDFPDGAFLNRTWWNALMDQREQDQTAGDG